MPSSISAEASAAAPRASDMPLRQVGAYDVFDLPVWRDAPSLEAIDEASFAKWHYRTALAFAVGASLGLWALGVLAVRLFA